MPLKTVGYAMKTACGYIHFGPVLMLSDKVVCFACKKTLQPDEVLTYRRLRLQVKMLIRDTHAFVTEYLKKRTV
jgi:hypothetical protein